MSIRSRLTAWYAVTLVLLVAAAGLVAWLGYTRIVRRTIDDALHARALDVVAGIAGGSGTVNDVADPAWADTFAVVYTPDGAVAAASRRVPAGLARPPLGDHTLRLAASPTTAPAAWAVDAVAGPGGREVVVGQPLGALDARLDAVAWAVGLAGLLLVAGATLGGWLLAGHALAPVDAMVRRARDIGEREELGGRLPVPARDDELGRLARTLNASLDRLAATVAREHRFLAAASHDLRTPIAALRTELELAATYERDPERLLASIRAAHGDAVRLGTLASELLALAEAAPDGRAVHREPVDVGALLDEVAHRAGPLADAAGVRVRCSPPPGAALVPVSVDRVRTAQALANLLANAVAAAPAGTAVEVRAALAAGTAGTAGTDDASAPRPGAGAAPGGALLAVDVLDRGPGLPPSLRERLFQPFASAPAEATTRAGVSGPSLASSGAGLGLATAAAAVRAQGGSIGYRDRPGGGAWFWIRVPAMPDAATIPAWTSDPPPSRTATPSSPSGRPPA